MSITAPSVDKTSTPKKPRRLRKTAAPRVLGSMTYEEYVVFNRKAQRKHQLIEGTVIELSGASHEHNLITSQMLYVLLQGIDAANLPYDVYGSDQAVYANRRNSFYPDITVAPRNALVDEQDRLYNPVVIVEVLSDSTRAYDSDKKFKAYQTIPSFRHYLLISQDEIFVKHFAKNAEGVWVIAGLYSERNDTITLELEGGIVTFSIADIYRRVAFEDE